MTTQSIGVDVGKTELIASMRRENGKTDASVLFANSTPGLKKFLVYLKTNDISSDDPILFESTGPYHWMAARNLADNGYFVKVAIHCTLNRLPGFQSENEKQTRLIHKI